MSTQTSVLLKVLLFLMMICSFVVYNNLYDIGDVTEYLIVAFFLVAFGGIFLNKRRNDRKRKKRKAEQRVRIEAKKEEIQFQFIILI